MAPFSPVRRLPKAQKKRQVKHGVIAKAELRGSVRKFSRVDDADANAIIKALGLKKAPEKEIMKRLFGYQNARHMEAQAMSQPLRTARLVDNVLTENKRRNIIRRHVGNTGLETNDVDLLSDAINYKSVQNINDAFAKAGAWLKKSVGSLPYAVAKGDAHISPPKLGSEEWMMHKAIEAIGRWPTTFLTLSYPPELIRAYNAGVRSLVVFDDAAYSGMNAAGWIRSFAESLQKVPIMIRRSMYLYVAFGYISPQADHFLKKVLDDLPKFVHVQVFAPKMFKSTGESLRNIHDAPKQQQNRIVKFLSEFINSYGVTSQYPIDHYPTMSMLAHKVPNMVSFPQKLGRMFSPHLVPPYKHVQPDLAAAPLHVYSKGGLRYHVRRHGNNRYHHTAYKNVRGHLEAVPSKSFWKEMF